MKRRTRRWSQVAQEARRLASIGLTPKEIADRLEVNKTTVNRWIKAGKLKIAARVIDIMPARAEKTPSEWAKAIRGEYDLDETDDQLVKMAETAAAIAEDATAKRSERLNAMRTFRGIVAQLRLVARAAAEAEQDQPVAVNAPAVMKSKNPPVRRKPSADPRVTLRAVK